MKIITKKENDAGYRQIIDMLHEIKAFYFLKKYAKSKLILEISMDNNHEEGPDYKLGNNQIECVCCHEGRDENDNKKDKELGELHIIKEGIKHVSHNFVMSRITSSLKEKVEKFEKYTDAGIVREDQTHIIFVSLGELGSHRFIAGDCEIILRVLVGMSDYVIKVNQNENISIERSFVEHFEKRSGAIIKAKWFKEYNDLDAVIFTDAKLDEIYDDSNTFFLVNPFLKRKVNDLFKCIQTYKRVKDNYICTLSNK